MFNHTLDDDTTASYLNMLKRYAYNGDIYKSTSKFRKDLENLFQSGHEKFNQIYTSSYATNYALREFHTENAVVTFRPNVTALHQYKDWFGEKSNKFPSTVDKDFIINCKDLCGVNKKIDYLYLVHSATDNFDRRMGIRTTFGRKILFGNFTQRAVFVLGKTNYPSITGKIQQEAEEYKDIVQGDFMDTYHNLSLKGVVAYRWVALYCPNTRVVIKIDDDTFVNPYKIVQKIEPSLYDKPKQMWCRRYLQNKKPISRELSSKWTVDQSEFRNLSHFPITHCNGFFLIMTPDLIRPLLEAARITPFFWVDDIYLYGMLPYTVGDVNFVDIEDHVALNYTKGYECLKTNGTSCRYYCINDNVMVSNVYKRDENYFRSLWHLLTRHSLIYI